MRGLSLIAAVLVLLLTATVAAAASFTFTPNQGPPGTTVTVDIRLDTPPVADAQYALSLWRNVDDPNNFVVVDPIPFDAQGHANFTFVVPDVAAGVYEVHFDCTGNGCTSEDAPDFRPFEGTAFTVTEAAPAATGNLPDAAVDAPSSASHFLLAIVLLGLVVVVFRALALTIAYRRS